MTTLPVSNVIAMAARYDQQQFYAEHAAKIQSPKTFQMGITAQIAISRAAYYTTQALAPSVSMASKPITYDDPRREIRRQQMENQPKLRITENTAEFRTGIEAYKVEQANSSR